MSDSSRVGNTAKGLAWEKRTTTRCLYGVEYRMLEDPEDIHDFINTEVRKELETDSADGEESQRQVELINSLPKRKWSLQVVKVVEVLMNPLIVESIDGKTRRRFTERLRERRLELRKALEERGAIIRPIVPLSEGLLLVDGYCRHSALKEMRIPEAYSYVGHIVDR